MEQNNTKKYKLPGIGMRIIKSAFGVLMCFAVYFLRDKQGTPFYSALAVLWCVQNQSKNSLGNALQRTIGTSIGAVYGLVYILFKQSFISFEDSFLHYLIISILIIPILYTTVILKQKKASYFSCVVFLSIVVNHLTDENPYIFVLNRSQDTLIGIFIGLVINSVHIHGKLNKDNLFVVNIDKTLDNNEEKLSAYSNVTIKNMIEDGINLTFCSRFTPATILENMPEIKPSLPVITMDGAVLYDIKENRYPKIYAISAKHSGEVEDFIAGRGFNVFTTVILEDVL
nr:FUSC family protein [Butyrivibrio sp.]